MEGNDFILFKNGCGNDSTHHGRYEYEFTDEAKERFENPCRNTIFDHVAVEFIGNQSYIYNSLEHPNDDSDPVIFKIRNSRLQNFLRLQNRLQSLNRQQA